MNLRDNCLNYNINIGMKFKDNLFPNGDILEIKKIQNNIIYFKSKKSKIMEELNKSVFIKLLNKNIYKQIFGV